MDVGQKFIEEVDLGDRSFRRTQGNNTSLYVLDLLSELQTISRVGGMHELSIDLERLLLKHR